MKPNKAAMKALREERKPFVEAARKRMKETNQLMKQIREQLATGGKTIPEIAESAGLPPAQVLWGVATLRKFGTVVEGEEDGDYFRYEAAAAEEGTS